MWWLLACQGATDSGGSGGPGGPPDTDVVDTQPATDTAPDWPEGLVLVEQDTATRPGFVREIWQSTELVDVDGEPAELWWYRPVGETETGLMIVLHGSTAADDSLGTEACEVDVAERSRVRLLEDWGLVTQIALAEGFSVLAPLNGWCDVWLGQGTDDPVDTTHHGRAWLAESLAFVDHPASCVTTTGRKVAWGSSTGAVGAVQAAVMAGLDAVLLDSGPVDFSDAEQPSFQRVLEHVLGPSDEQAELWAARDPLSLVADGALQSEVFVLFNEPDLINSASHAFAMEAALAKSQLAWGSHDMAHLSPGTTYHVQGGLPLPPWGFYTEAVMDVLLDGRRLEVVEAELPCDACALGALWSSSDWMDDASGAAGRRARDEEGSGVMASFELPAEVPEGVTVTARAVIGLDQDEVLDDDTEVAVLRWAGTVQSQTLTYGQLSVLSDDGLPPRSLYNAARLELPEATPGAVFEVEALGTATLLVDAALFLW